MIAIIAGITGTALGVLMAVLGSYLGLHEFGLKGMGIALLTGCTLILVSCCLIGYGLG